MAATQPLHLQARVDGNGLVTAPRRREESDGFVREAVRVEKLAEKWIGIDQADMERLSL